MRGSTYERHHSIELVGLEDGLRRRKAQALEGKMHGANGSGGKVKGS